MIKYKILKDGITVSKLFSSFEEAKEELENIKKASSLRIVNVQKVRLNSNFFKIFEVWEKVGTKLVFRNAGFAHHLVKKKNLALHVIKTKQTFNPK